MQSPHEVVECILIKCTMDTDGDAESVYLNKRGDETILTNEDVVKSIFKDSCGSPASNRTNIPVLHGFSFDQRQASYATFPGIASCRSFDSTSVMTEVEESQTAQSKHSNIARYQTTHNSAGSLPPAMTRNVIADNAKSHANLGNRLRGRFRSLAKMQIFHSGKETSEKTPCKPVRQGSARVLPTLDRIETKKSIGHLCA